MAGSENDCKLPYSIKEWELLQKPPAFCPAGGCLDTKACIFHPLFKCSVCSPLFFHYLFKQVLLSPPCYYCLLSIQFRVISFPSGLL